MPLLDNIYKLWYLGANHGRFRWVKRYSFYWQRIVSPSSLQWLSHFLRNHIPTSITQLYECHNKNPLGSSTHCELTPYCCLCRVRAKAIWRIIAFTECIQELWTNLSSFKVLDIGHIHESWIFCTYLQRLVSQHSSNNINSSNNERRLTPSLSLLSSIAHLTKHTWERFLY